MKRYALFALLVCLSALAAGCAKNTVRLQYPQESPAVPSAAAAKICVVRLGQAWGGDRSVGVRADGSEFMPDSDVQDWMTHALAVALTQQGLNATTTYSESAARAAGCTNILTGEIQQVRLTENSMTSYDSSMRVVINLDTPKGRIWKNSFSSGVTRTVVPFSSAPDDVLAENLKDITDTMARAVKEKLAP